MNMKLLIAMTLVLASGCSILMNTKSAALQTPPFATEQLQGSVTDATTCVGRYWQAFARRPESESFWGGSYWEVTTAAYEVEVKSNNGGQPVIGPVIEFEDRNGKTFGLAYTQKLPRALYDADRRSVTQQAFAACKAPTIDAPSAAGSPQAAPPVQQTQANSGTLPTVPRVVGATFAPSTMGIGVLSVDKNSAASRAGLRAGDLITHINGRNVAPLYWENAVALLTTSGSSVSVRLMGSNEERVLTFPN
jgi:PDZ domain